MVDFPNIASMIEVLFYFVFLSLFFKSSQKQNPLCKPHSWSIKNEHQNPYMICDKCKFLPSHDMIWDESEE